MPTTRRGGDRKLALRATAYAADAVITVEQLATALQISVRMAEMLDLPTVYLGKRTRRYVWHQVVETLRERAE